MKMINIEKAKDRITIETYQKHLHELTTANKDLLDKIANIGYMLNTVLLRKPENLHFDSEEDACEYFDELVCNAAWDGNEEVYNILVNCYINGVLYMPVYYQREFDRGDCCIKMEVVK